MSEKSKQQQKTTSTVNGNRQVVTGTRSTEGGRFLSVETLTLSEEGQRLLSFKLSRKDLGRKV